MQALFVRFTPFDLKSGLDFPEDYQTNRKMREVIEIVEVWLSSALESGFAISDQIIESGFTIRDQIITPATLVIHHIDEHLS